MNQKLALFITATILLFNFSNAGAGIDRKVITNVIVSFNDSSIKKNTREEKWTLFWKDFTNAITSKNKKRIAELVSKDFFDGGGSTLEQWLDNDVYFDNKHFNAIKLKLAKGAKSFNSYGYGPYKATGKNNIGDLFFQYKNGNWEFGGLVGD
ncbi:MAG: hypothetical protein ABI402_09985 [Ferruginibacter sp.]